MSAHHALLDQIVARTGPLPPHVRVLRFPGIEGWEPGRVWTTWNVDPDFIQPQGAVFGGYLAALADEITGLATFTVLDDGARFATADVRTNFFRAIRGGAIRVEGVVVHNGRSNIHVEATFTDEEGRLCAKAAATQTVLRG